MKKFIFFIIILLFLSLNFSYTIKAGIEISGHIFPYIGISYKLNNFEVEGDFATIAAPYENGIIVLYEPILKLKYYTDFAINLEGNFRIINVSIENRRLFLTGGGLGCNLFDGKFNLSILTELILPFSASKEFKPVPFLSLDYTF
ncbi:hypothetical protein OSSY52_19570 [Tepiditoga spiralis]|uniref:Outer membrane protein beta-barrel domain-containing protein n=1 Tax=Tepiditoga spiralis TaxID=2108365 RepID=A0A7G1G8Q8_9BACT|nr:hypothetical protein [Tepiditoga spiralis]BBE31816.1 hypothetical protein OSSY52_19570 [Tepiditoga spiralis]